MSSPKAIVFKEYGFKYEHGEEWVLKNVSFDMAYGEMVLLSGLSGEGKSTLLSSINGIIPHTLRGEQRGHVFVNNVDVSSLHPSETARFVGSVLQNADSQIINHLVEDEIAFGCENLGLAPNEIALRVKEACDQMRLSPDWSTKTLSGGQKQKVITATTLAMGQRILILDEPLANLDLESAKHLLKRLKALSASGYAIFIVEHRIDVVLPFVDRVLTLQNGCIRPYQMKTDAIQKAVAALGNAVDSSPVATTENLLALEGIQFGFKNKPILKGVNLKIQRGTRLVILGENGCGKTTLLKLISKLLHPTSGVYQQALDLDTKKKPSKAWFKKLGYVYQNPAYQLFMSTVEDEVHFGASSKEMGDRMMEAFHLSHLKERHPHSLSEGQKRRLSIAAVLATSPNVLLLDEPTVGQDYEGLRQIVHTLNTYNKAFACTLITITHDFRCAKNLADQIAWMKDGQIYKVGGPELADEYAAYVASHLGGD